MRLVKKTGSRTLALSAANRRFDRARSGEIRARRIDRYRQADFARALARYSARGREFPILRDRDSAHRIGSAHHRRRGVQLHAASAARHRRTDFAVESAALFVELENRAGHRGRKHRHREAERANADDGLHALRNRARSRSAEWSSQCRPRHRTECRLGDYRASEDQHHLVHRRHRDRAQSRRSVRAVVQKGFARARRQKSKHHFRRCRSRRRNRRQRAFVIRKPGTGLLVRVARVCRAIGLQGFRRALHRQERHS